MRMGDTTSTKVAARLSTGEYVADGFHRVPAHNDSISPCVGPTRSSALSGETGPAGTWRRRRVRRRSALLFTARAASVAQQGGDRSGEGRPMPGLAISNPRGPAPPGAFWPGLRVWLPRAQPIRAQPGGCPGSTSTRLLAAEWTLPEALERSCAWQRRSGAFALFRKQRRAPGWRTQTACFALGARRPSVLLGRRLGSEGSHRVRGGRLPGALGGHPVRTFPGVTPASTQAVLQGSKPRRERRRGFPPSGASFFQELHGSGRGLPALGAGSSRVTPGRFDLKRAWLDFGSELRACRPCLEDRATRPGSHSESEDQRR